MISPLILSRNHNHLLLLLLVSLLPLLTSAWVCFPPVHLLPDQIDCATLILGLDHISQLPSDAGMKRWGRHLATTANSEMLPKWYYVVDEAGRPPATCAIKVDSGGDSSEVDGFRLANVVDAAKAVYRNCLDRKGQVGLEFPGDGHIFAQLMRLDGMPPHGLLQQAGGARDEGGVRMERMPGGKVLYVSDLEPGMPGNVSQTS